MPTTTTRPTAAIQLREATGTSARVHYAQRVDGQWYTRLQDRHPRYGYTWTRWTPCDAPRIGFDYDHDYGQASAGTMRLDGHERLRLPAPA